VRVSVRESRYFTMTGVASDSCHSGPLPAVTARVPNDGPPMTQWLIAEGR
jgi:hypothetical protein